MTDHMHEATALLVRDQPLSIEVTTRCNSTCSYCFTRAGIAEPSSLSLELAKEIVIEGYDAAYRHLHITGGEPLLWEGLLEVLDFAFDLGYIAAFLNTNGTLLTEKVRTHLAAHEGLALSVSLGGPETLHDETRGLGSYRQTIRSIEKALDAGLRLTLFVTVGRRLLPDLPHFAKEIYTRFPGIEYLTLIQLVRVRDDFFDLSEELLGPTEFLQLVRSASLLNVYGYKTYFLNDPLASLAATRLRLPWVPRARPLYVEGCMFVRANGDITLSHTSSQRFGKYAPGRIREVLDSPPYRKAVAPDVSTCPSCKHAEICKEYGILRPSEWYMDMHPEVPYCRRVLDETQAS